MIQHEAAESWHLPLLTGLSVSLSVTQMVIPGLNAPGLVPAKVVPKAGPHGNSGAAFENIRDGASSANGRRTERSFRFLCNAAHLPARALADNKPAFGLSPTAAGNNHFWSPKGIMNSVPKVSVASCTGCRAPALRLATVSAQRLSAVSELTTHSRSPALLLLA